ncbi:MAG: RIP metalloprotease RseP [Fimbriimonadaceae bacterium]|nr:RIP metalloprotease RseP [Fimbriimonadaceae bacterium]
MFEDHAIWFKLLRGLQIVCVLGGIILIHELGHFLVAKWSRMEVDEFAVGVGPTIWSRRRGETLYRVCPFLFMGYVRIRGLEGEPTAEVAPHTFYARPVYQQVATLVAGAAFNVLLAVVIFCLLFGLWGVPPRPDTTVAKVVAGSAADVAGVAPGWRIAAVDGRPTQQPDQVKAAVQQSGGRPLQVTLQQGELTRAVTLTPQAGRTGSGYKIGVEFADRVYLPVVSHTEPAGPARQAGLLPDDRIVAVNGTPVAQPTDILLALQQVPEADELRDPGEVTLPGVVLQVARGGQLHDLTVVPRPRKDQRLAKLQPGQNEDDRRVETYLLGEAGLALQREFHRLGAGAALVEGCRTSYEVLHNVLRSIVDLFTGRKFDQVGGPVQIVKLLSEQAFLGAWDLINWAGLLSIMIGVFNLLPLPALDGGRIIFVLLTPVARRALRLVGFKEASARLVRQIEGYIHAVGLVLLLLLMVLVSVRDVARGW